MRQTPEERYKAVQAYAKYSGIGLQMAVSLGVPMYAGWWLDDRYGWSPWALLAGILLGMVSVFSMLFKLARMSGGKP